MGWDGGQPVRRTRRVCRDSRRFFCWVGARSDRHVVGGRRRRRGARHGDGPLSISAGPDPPVAIAVFFLHDRQLGDSLNSIAARCGALHGNDEFCGRSATCPCDPDVPRPARVAPPTLRGKLSREPRRGGHYPCEQNGRTRQLYLVLRGTFAGLIPTPARGLPIAQPTPARGVTGLGSQYPTLPG